MLWYTKDCIAQTFYEFSIISGLQLFLSEIEPQMKIANFIGSNYGAFK